jgi:hypothetical protein
MHGQSHAPFALLPKEKPQNAIKRELEWSHMQTEGLV